MDPISSRGLHARSKRPNRPPAKSKPPRFRPPTRLSFRHREGDVQMAHFRAVNGLAELHHLAWVGIIRVLRGIVVFANRFEFGVFFDVNGREWRDIGARLPPVIKIWHREKHLLLALAV